MVQLVVVASALDRGKKLFSEKCWLVGKTFSGGHMQRRQAFLTRILKQVKCMFYTHIKTQQIRHCVFNTMTQAWTHLHPLFLLHLGKRLLSTI
uniref:Uncharacterized protein n=1 Tax=Arundo donax TaxID=35708 RepID=A0A0A9EBX2_ARUDO